MLYTLVPLTLPKWCVTGKQGSLRAWLVDSQGQRSDPLQVGNPGQRQTTCAQAPASTAAASVSQPLPESHSRSHPSGCCQPMEDRPTPGGSKQTVLQPAVRLEEEASWLPDPGSHSQSSSAGGQRARGRGGSRGGGCGKRAPSVRGADPMASALGYTAQDQSVMQGVSSSLIPRGPQAVLDGWGPVSECMVLCLLQASTWAAICDQMPQSVPLPELGTQAPPSALSNRQV